MGRRWDDFDDWARERRGRRRGVVLWPSVIAGLAVFYVFGIWTGAAIAHPKNNISYIPEPSTPQGATSGPGASGSSASSLPGVTNTSLVTDIYNQTKNSIFTITAVNSSNSSQSNSSNGNGSQEDIGTGFLIDNQGDIATNAHVVGTAKTVQVTVGTKKYKGNVLSADKLDDLAIVRISPPPDVPPLQLGTSKSLQPGSLVIAIGNPFELTSSVSSGIVSGLNRSMSEDGNHVMNGMIQTDAPLNPGNSGGPLLNAKGQVVGINTLIESPIEGSIGIGFAIPIDRLVSLEKELISGKTVQHAWLGIEGMDMDALFQQEMNLPTSSGVYVTDVTKNSPAAKAGLHGDSNGAKLNNASSTTDPTQILKGDGDIITAIDGTSVGSIEALTQQINQDKPGQSVTLTVLRGGKTIQLKVTLGTWPSS